MVDLARDYATKREAFGKPLKDHPLHMQTLARMEVSTRPLGSRGTWERFQNVLLLFFAIRCQCREGSIQLENFNNRAKHVRFRKFNPLWKERQFAVVVRAQGWEMGTSSPTLSYALSALGRSSRQEQITSEILSKRTAGICPGTCHTQGNSHCHPQTMVL